MNTNEQGFWAAAGVEWNDCDHHRPISTMLKLKIMPLTVSFLDCILISSRHDHNLVKNEKKLSAIPRTVFCSVTMDGHESKEL